MARFTVAAHLLKQKSYELYLFPMNSMRLKQLCYVTPRSRNSPEEVQRILDPKRAREIGQYIQEDTSILPSAIVVSLTDEVIVRQSGADGQVTIEFPDEHGKFGYILDGQHRLEGFKHSDGIEFDLPVVALYNVDEHLRGKVFADINSKQERVSDVHLLSLYYQIRALPAETAATMDVIHRLAKDPDSPLRGKIKLMDDDRGTWVTNRHMKVCLAPHTESGGVLYDRTPGAKAQVIKEFLKGVRDLWPEAWGNNRDYMLTRAMGVEIILSALGAAKHRCDLNSGRQYTAETFKLALAPLKNAEIVIPGGGHLPLTWGRGPFGPLSNKAGKVLIHKQLTNYLRKADDAETSG
jgi:DGQHR domain-containing protein